jgi:hypothetical protein
MNLNRRILALYLVVLGTLAALAGIHAQALGYGQVLEARNQTVITYTVSQPKPIAQVRKGPGGGLVIVP